MKKKTTKKVKEITGKVMYTPNPNHPKAVCDFRNGDYGFNVPILVKGAKSLDRNVIVLCNDARVLFDGQCMDADGNWVEDKSMVLKRGDVIRARYTEVSKPKKPVKTDDGKTLNYLNYWVNSFGMVEKVGSEANRPRPGTKAKSSRPRG